MIKSPLQHRKTQLREAIDRSMETIDSAEHLYNYTRGKRNLEACCRSANQSGGTVLLTKQTIEDVKKLSGFDTVPVMLWNNPKAVTNPGPIHIHPSVLFEMIKSHHELKALATQLLGFMDQKGID